ncbi:adenosine deaminase CECR1-A [Cladorrhinum sp. PSN332]|nr:adenosine deaminase CECR1-A [Cladorrhinum sp. PSN332]
MPISDEEWQDLLAHEIPSPDDPVIQKYLSSKEALTAEEKKHRADNSFRQALSPIAKKACTIFSRLLAEESETPEEAEAEDPTKSYTILQLLPKGALLNVRLHDLIDLTHLAELAIETEGLLISCAEAGGNLATSEARRRERRRRNASTVRIRVGKAAAAASEGGSGSGLGLGSSIWSRDYKPNSLVNLAEAADSFPEHGRAGFLTWLRGRFLGPAAGEDEDGGSERKVVVVEEDSAESLLCEVVYYEPIFRATLQRVLDLLVLDGVSWAELRLKNDTPRRLIFPIKFYRESSETPEEDYDYLFKVIREEVAGFRAGLKSDQTFWGIRVIWSTSSTVTEQRALIQDMDDCITTKISYPDLVAGYDPSSVLTKASKEGYIVPSLFWFRKQCAVEGVEVPFLFGSTSGDDLFHTLLLGARRVGIKDEGRKMLNHPRFLEAVKDKKILVGVEPMPLVPVWRGAKRSRWSTAGTVEGLAAQGVSCAIGVNEERCLSRELWNVLNEANGKGEEANLDLATLGWMAENSVRWAGFEDSNAGDWTREIREASVGSGTKAERLRKWAVEWEKFCLCVVDEFGEDVDVGGDDKVE